MLSKPMRSDNAIEQAIIRASDRGCAVATAMLMQLHQHNKRQQDADALSKIEESTSSIDDSEKEMTRLVMHLREVINKRLRRSLDNRKPCANALTIVRLCRATLHRCRALCRTFRIAIDTSDIFVLLRERIKDPFRHIEYLNRDLQLPQEILTTVEAMMRFKKSYIRQTPRKPEISAHYCKVQGMLMYMTQGYTSMIRDDWKRLARQIVALRAKDPKRITAHAVAELLIRTRDWRLLTNHTTFNRRSASEPRIRNPTRRTMRSKSLPMISIEVDD